MILTGSTEPDLYPGLHPPEPPVRPAGHSLPDLSGYGRCPDGYPGQPLQPAEHGAHRYLPSADGRQKLPFAKMQTCGNDYIFLENFTGDHLPGVPVRHPLRPALRHRRRRHRPDGGSREGGCQDADVQRRRQRGLHGGNALRCMGKYLYDNGIVRKEEMTLETDRGSGVKGTPLHHRRQGDLRLRGHGLRDPGYHGPPAEHPGRGRW